MRNLAAAFSIPREGVAKDGAIRYAPLGATARRLHAQTQVLSQYTQDRDPFMSAIHDKARAISKAGAYAVSCRERKVEMLFIHLKRILRLGRLLSVVQSGAKDEFYCLHHSPKISGNWRSSFRSDAIFAT